MDIVSRQNDTVRRLKRLGTSRGYREETGLFLLEGDKLLGEAASHGLRIREALYCGERPPHLTREARAYSVPRELLEYVSTQKTPQNVICSAEIPDMGGRPELHGAVVLENIQDPGNVGAMLRSANAFGVPWVILVGDCADLWSPKTVRASMGAVFRQRAVRMTLGELLKLKKASGVPVYGAALRPDSRDIRKTAVGSAAVCIGNEGQGLSDELLALSDGSVIIPMAPECESLNAAAAAAVLMWEMARDRL